MTTTAAALLIYIAWTLFLALALVSIRAAMVLSGRRAANDFKPTGDDVSPFVLRLTRAHANLYEHFPIVGGLLLFALATGQTAVTDPLALWMLGARVAQSVTHLVSTSPMAVQVRFAFLIGQLGIAVWWLYRFLSDGMAG